jgi:long-chain acyl-CoA synthetase
MNLDKIKNFAQLFIEAMNNYGDRTVLQWKEDNEYKALSGNKLKELVYKAAARIEKFNLKPRDKAAIISESRFEWVVTDFACIFNKIVTVPIYTTITPEQIGYILRHSESTLCFVSNKMLLEKVMSVKASLPELNKIICYNDIENVPENVLRFDGFLKSGNASTPLGAKDATSSITEELLRKKADDLNENELLTIIYTSGTTGVPKGVCLSHKNILSNIRSCHTAFKVDESDTSLSFLPLAHSYERTAGYYFKISGGVKIVYSKSMDTLMQQMGEIKPTFMTSVPLFFHKMHSRVLKSTENMPPIKRKIFLTGLKVGQKYREKKNHPLWKLFDLLVFKKIKRRLGGRLRFFVSGGSALNKETGEFFDSVGVKILEGYGITEASPVISANREDNNKFGTVGIPLDGVTVKIADDGEIIVHGDNIMKGYYKDEEETRKTIINGWLHTGDIGEFDEYGRLKITDRKKTLYKTEGGKYVSLTHIEDTINQSKYIDQIIAFGSDRMFVSALIVPDFEELKAYAERNDINHATNEELTEHPQALKLIETEIEQYQNDLAKYERVRRFTLLSKPFSIETGELTPTLKIKRKVIEEKYREQIEKMYQLR